MVIDFLIGIDFWFIGEYMGLDGFWSIKIMFVKFCWDFNDVGIQAFILLQFFGYFIDVELVQVVVWNFGYKFMFGYIIGFQFENGMVFIDIIMDMFVLDSVYFYMFVEIVNMMLIDFYDFLFFISYLLDIVNFNDIFWVQVEQFFCNDVVIVEVLGLEQNICDILVFVEIVI